MWCYIPERQRAKQRPSLFRLRLLWTLIAKEWFQEIWQYLAGAMRQFSANAASGMNYAKAEWADWLSPNSFSRRPRPAALRASDIRSKHDNRFRSQTISTLCSGTIPANEQRSLSSKWFLQGFSQCPSDRKMWNLDSSLFAILLSTHFWAVVRAVERARGIYCKKIFAG